MQQGLPKPRTPEDHRAWQLVDFGTTQNQKVAKIGEGRGGTSDDDSTAGLCLFDARTIPNVREEGA